MFQADLNTTNLLLDENGEFVGVFDFNLCGRDVFLNYLFREIHYQYELQYLLDTLKNVSYVYSFLANTTLTAMLDRMEAAGLIVRKPDPKDRRNLWRRRNVNYYSYGQVKSL